MGAAFALTVLGLCAIGCARSDTDASFVRFGLSIVVMALLLASTTPYSSSLTGIERPSESESVRPVLRPAAEQVPATIPSDCSAPNQHFYD